MNAVMCLLHYYFAKDGSFAEVLVLSLIIYHFIENILCVYFKKS